MHKSRKGEKLDIRTSRMVAYSVFAFAATLSHRKSSPCRQELNFVMMVDWIRHHENAADITIFNP